jgi:hypothetical protein
MTGATGGGEKPAGAWSAAETVLYMLDRVRAGDFYILCPDNDTRPEVDALRIMWAAGGASSSSPLAWTLTRARRRHHGEPAGAEPVAPDVQEPVRGVHARQPRGDVRLAAARHTCEATRVYDYWRTAAPGTRIQNMFPPPLDEPRAADESPTPQVKVTKRSPHAPRVPSTPIYLM